MIDLSAILRKLQLTGGSTYIISLPSEWVHRNSLTKGSQLLIEESGSNLTLKISENVTKEKTRTLDFSSSIDLALLQRAMTSFYIAGYDTLTLHSDSFINNTLRDSIKTFTKLLMGVEIFEESSDTIVLQNVLDSRSFPIEKALRRMSTNVSVMLSDVGKALADHNRDLLESVIRRDDEVDRFHWYIFREVRNIWDSEAPFFLILSRILERVADHAVNIATLLLQFNPGKIRASGIMSAMYEFSVNTYEEAVSAFYSRHFSGLNGLVERKREIIQKKKEMLDSLKGSDPIQFYAVVSEEISRIGSYGTDIAELAMDMILSGNESLRV